MSKRKKKKKPIFVDSLHLKRDEGKLLKDTTVVEKVAVFRVSRRIGRLLSGLTIITGFTLFSFSLHVMVTTTQFYLPWLRSFFSSVFGFLRFDDLFTPQIEPLLMAGIVFLGLINALCGLILLTKE